MIELLLALALMHFALFLRDRGRAVRHQVTVNVPAEPAPAAAHAEAVPRAASVLHLAGEPNDDGAQFCVVCGREITQPRRLVRGTSRPARAWPVDALVLACGCGEAWAVADEDEVVGAERCQPEVA